MKHEKHYCGHENLQLLTSHEIHAITITQTLIDLQYIKTTVTQQILLSPTQSAVVIKLHIVLNVCSVLCNRSVILMTLMPAHQEEISTVDVPSIRFFI